MHKALYTVLILMCRTEELGTESFHTCLAGVSLRHLDAEYLIKEGLYVIAEFLNFRTLIHILPHFSF